MMLGNPIRNFKTSFFSMPHGYVHIYQYCIYRPHRLRWFTRKESLDQLDGKALSSNLFSHWAWISPAGDGRVRTRHDSKGEREKRNAKADWPCIHVEGLCLLQPTRTFSDELWIIDPRLIARVGNNDSNRLPKRIRRISDGFYPMKIKQQALIRRMMANWSKKCWIKLKAHFMLVKCTSIQ